MGLFSAESGYQEVDYSETLNIAKEIAILWNNELADFHGFKLEVYSGSVEECARRASRVFEGEISPFAQSPSPYKRIAAYLVMGCLEPFWGFVPRGKPPTWGIDRIPKDDAEKRRWHVRFLLISLPYLISRLEIKIEDNWESVEWHGFPSTHYQLEFMNWLRWLEGLDHIQSLKDLRPADWEDLQRNRIARMVMATSLMIESCCYCDTESKKNHQGKTRNCMASLSDEDRLDLEFMNIPGN